MHVSATFCFSSFLVRTEDERAPMYKGMFPVQNRAGANWGTGKGGGLYRCFNVIQLHTPGEALLR